MAIAVLAASAAFATLPAVQLTDACVTEGIGSSFAVGAALWGGAIDKTIVPDEDGDGLPDAESLNLLAAALCSGVTAVQTPFDANRVLYDGVLDAFDHIVNTSGPAVAAECGTTATAINAAAALMTGGLAAYGAALSSGAASIAASGTELGSSLCCGSDSYHTYLEALGMVGDWVTGMCSASTGTQAYVAAVFGALLSDVSDAGDDLIAGAGQIAGQAAMVPASLNDTKTLVAGLYATALKAAMALPQSVTNITLAIVQPAYLQAIAPADYAVLVTTYHMDCILAGTMPFWTDVIPGGYSAALGGATVNALAGAVWAAASTQLTAAHNAMVSLATDMDNLGDELKAMSLPTFTVITGAKADNGEPFSGGGDYNENGDTNAAVYDSVGGGAAFVAAASGAEWQYPGNPGVPVAGIFGLALLAGACVMGGAASIRRK
jgi:hypothetical protein